MINIKCLLNGKVNLQHHRLREREVDLRSNVALYFRDWSVPNISEFPRCQKHLALGYIWKDYLIRTFEINKCVENGEKQELSFWFGIHCSINVLESDFSISHKVADTHARGAANLFLHIFTRVILSFVHK